MSGYSRLFLNPFLELREAMSSAFDVQAFEFLDNGSWNQCARCRREGGDLFVKILQPRAGHSVRSLEAIEFVYLKLREVAFDPTIRIIMPLVWPNGDLVCRFDGALALVFPFIEELVPFDLANSGLDAGQWIRRAATALAAFHAGVQSITGEVKFNAVGSDIPHVVGLRAWLEGRDAYFLSASTRLRQNSPAFDLRQLDFARRFSDGLINSIQKSRQTVALIHGDFRADNVSFDRKTRKLAIFDFDLCRIGSLEEDIVYAALNFAGARWLYCSVDWKRFWRFLDLYYEAMGSAMPRDILWWAGWVVTKWISLAFKEEQVIERTKLLREIASSALPGARLRGVAIPSIDE